MTLSVKAKISELGHNIDEFRDEFIAVFREFAAGVAKASQAEWVRIAQDRLKTSRDIYINGLRQSESFTHQVIEGEPVWHITLVGDMPNNFEFGMASFDMKDVRPGWLGGSKARTAADGSNYVIIPFRHSTSNSPRLAYTGKAAMADLKTKLKTTVKEYGLDRLVRSATGTVVSGQVKKVPAAPDIHRYLHGLTKIQKQSVSDPKKGSGTLMTWRVMSEHSDPSSWIHPGLQAVHIADEVERYAENELANAITTVLGTKIL